MYLHINNVQRQAVVEKAWQQGEVCPGCGSSRELESGELLRLYADGSAEVQMWCNDNDCDPGRAWWHGLSSEDLRELNISTGQ